jgi:DivIVA domain-containing protein
MPDLTPDDVARREFRSGFRGYETSEVRSFLAEVAAGLTALVEDRAALAARLAEVQSQDLKSEIAAISREVGEVLEAARQAAQTMRERAGADATRWRSEAIAEADAERSRAAVDAERLRTDAWTMSEQLLSQCQVQAAKVVEAAEQEALRLVGEAEREAHRLMASSRREADDLVRGARMEAERLSAEAKGRHDELIESAMRQSEAAQERTLALEQRRQELLRELEAVRTTLIQVEGELDQRRERLGLSPPEPPPLTPPPMPAAAKVVTASPPPVPRPAAASAGSSTSQSGSDETGMWVPGETVRVVRPERHGEEPTVSQVSPQTLEPEVKILSGQQFARVKAGLDPGDAGAEGQSPLEKPAPEPQPKALDEDATVKVVRPNPVDTSAEQVADSQPEPVVEEREVLGEPVVHDVSEAEPEPAVEPALDSDAEAAVAEPSSAPAAAADGDDSSLPEVPTTDVDDDPGVSPPVHDLPPESDQFEDLAVPPTIDQPVRSDRDRDEGAAAFEERGVGDLSREMPVFDEAPLRPAPYRPIDQPVPAPVWPPRLQSAPRIVSAPASLGEPAPTRESDDPETVTGAGSEEQPQLFADVSGLFSRLRTDDVPHQPGATPVEPVMSRRLTASMVDPFEVRDRLLLPIGNRALRNLKRQLTEAQNEALEEIRLDEAHWEPTADSVHTRVKADLVVLFAESFGAGHAAAEEMMGGRVSRPATPRGDVGVDFVDDLVRELVQVLSEGRHAGHGARQLGSSLSRVFRGWRTDQSERRVRDLSLAAYHEGLVRSLELTDVTDLAWRVAGRGCATCRAAGETRPHDLVPPAHPGCECTVSP